MEVDDGGGGGYVEVEVIRCSSYNYRLDSGRALSFSLVSGVNYSYQSSKNTSYHIIIAVEV